MTETYDPRTFDAIKALSQVFPLPVYSFALSTYVETWNMIQAEAFGGERPKTTVTKIHLLHNGVEVGNVELCFAPLWPEQWEEEGRKDYPSLQSQIKYGRWNLTCANHEEDYEGATKHLKDSIQRIMDAGEW